MENMNRFIFLSKRVTSGTTWGIDRLSLLETYPRSLEFPTIWSDE